ncbi:hypothetical protein PENSOL_c022G07497 [Penicillium solitum]|uniref:Metallo-beta-lactamase domain-containing protein n=1 Tax=Penicillium solitum TaxID=60172 RepID=A0A1V6R172_9EURO|nr:uncharacterized protein PENSOL_c022G07497 [Penicillium solitum]OQD94986.1 hypothetical protein PENSOL_c022G07497 [Penicillium solitum]
MLRNHVHWFDIEKGVDEVLQDAEFDLTKLDAIIWSNWHWDHIGDSTRFPKSTKLVVGPGFINHFTPGWPRNPEGVLLDCDIEGRDLVEPTYPLEIGGFKAHDYFGDRSFYLLDVPGSDISAVSLEQHQPHLYSWGAIAAILLARCGRQWDIRYPVVLILRAKWGPKGWKAHDIASLRALGRPTAIQTLPRKVSRI